jgi:hypothetical protein
MPLPARESARAAGVHDRLGPSITPLAFKTFASRAHSRMRTEWGAYRRDHPRALAQRVEVNKKEQRAIASKSVLLRMPTAASRAKTAGFEVPSFYRSGAPEEIRTLAHQIRTASMAGRTEHRIHSEKSNRVHWRSTLRYAATAKRRWGRDIVRLRTLRMWPAQHLYSTACRARLKC